MENDMSGLARGRRAYFVDGRGGNDRRSGTSPSAAWRTLNRVSGMVFAPGDRILFRAGARYPGWLTLRGSGKKGKVITVGRYGEGRNPRMDGLGRRDETLLLSNGEYWEIADLEVTNTGRTRKPSRAGVRVHLSDFGTAHHIHLKRLFVHDVNGSNDKAAGGGRGIFCTNAGRRIRSRFDGLLIEGCRLVRTDRDGIGMWSDYVSRRG